MSYKYIRICYQRKKLLTLENNNRGYYIFKKFITGILVLFCICPLLLGVKAQSVILEDIIVVEADFYAGYESYLEKDERFNIEITNDAPIDLLLIEEGEFTKYENGSAFNYIKSASELNVEKTSYKFNCPKSAIYFIVIDNTADPENGAYANVSSNVHIIVTQIFSQDDEDSNMPSIPTLMMISGIILFILIIFFGLVVFKKIKIPKKGLQIPKKTLKGAITINCSKCKTPIVVKSTKRPLNVDCKKCGKKYTLK